MLRSRAMDTRRISVFYEPRFAAICAIANARWPGCSGLRPHSHPQSIRAYRADLTWL